MVRGTFRAEDVVTMNHDSRLAKPASGDGVAPAIQGGQVVAIAQKRALTQPLSRKDESDILTERVSPSGLPGFVRALRSYSHHERRTLLAMGDAILVATLYVNVTSLLALKASAISLPFGTLVTIVYLATFWLLDLYQQTHYARPTGNSIGDALAAYVKSNFPLARAAGLAALVIGTIGFFRPHWYPVQPKALVLHAVLTCVALSLWRLFFYRIFAMTVGKKRTLILGSAKFGWEFLSLARRYPQLGYQVVGFVDDEPANKGTLPLGLRHLGPYHQMDALVRGFDLDTLVLGPSDNRKSEAATMIANCLEVGVEILPLSALYERHFGIVPLQTIDESWFISNLAETNRGLFLNLKRAGDVLGALFGLILASPVMLLVALAIKLDSRGPIFYSQVRLGERCRPFRIYKFRTMRVDAEAGGAAWAQKNDPRITRIGRFLRKTRLDELPQLINVLKGDISIVGPRPERPEFVTKLKEKIPFYNRRHIVKPGLTGWAQVRYVYGASVEGSLEKLQYDLYYIKNRSVLLDIEIIVRTVWVVLMRKGAQ